MPPNEPGRSLKTLENALAIIDVIQERDALTIGEITDEVGFARSTVHGYVKTLENEDYLTKQNGSYKLGMAFLDKGGDVRIRDQQFRTTIPKIEEIAEETGERAQFIVEEHGIGTYIHTAIGNNAVRADSRIGKRINLHASSAGKSILAHLPHSRVTEIIDQHGLPALTENTVTDQEILFDELQKIRDRGYAVSDEESIGGLRAVGAPVLSNDTVIGGVSISGPAHRIKGERFRSELPNFLLGVTNELQLRLEYQ
ncbi:IclR family transcriptional regulator [Haloferax sp. AB510]|uniref:IclR family transcriptional regulator n=1 Tax=Haloferax sp. AB510 TaxID=2934172 RepID=UPI00209C0181|nr:IclR family transcriptional regulator [Haloferax sp. AB510]MCO8268273.1 IclR family transcriptional regulator [Haloferax sp. AB510]